MRTREQKTKTGGGQLSCVSKASAKALEHEKAKRKEAKGPEGEKNQPEKVAYRNLLLSAITSFSRTERGKEKKEGNR